LPTVEFSVTQPRKSPIKYLLYDAVQWYVVFLRRKRPPGGGGGAVGGACIIGPPPGALADLLEVKLTQYEIVNAPTSLGLHMTVILHPNGLCPFGFGDGRFMHY
jgi:hypothetical protein